MRNLSLLFVMLLVSQLLFAQKVIENPGYAYSTAGGLQITKIELTDTSTVCHFVYSGGPGASFLIPSGSYIRPDESTERLSVVKADNVPLDNWANIPSSGKAEYTLYFPPISKTAKMLEFGEGNEGGNWFIYEIELEKKPYKGAIAQNLSGYWYKTDGSKELVIALYDTVAVYQSQLWKYGKVTTTNKKTSIELTNGAVKQSVVLTSVDAENILFGALKQKELKLSNSPKEVKGYSNPNDKPYTAPVFVKDGKATYKGFIRNFNPKYITQKTGQIHVNNVLTGNQDSYTVKIANDGTFSITFPMAYPCQMYVEMPSIYESIFVSPGMETFHIIDINSSGKNIFMGELATINTGFMAVNKIRNFDYKKMQDSILSLNPEQYIAYCFQVKEHDLNDLKAYAALNYISPKVMQIKTSSIVYSAMSNAMEYEWTYESAYRKKNNIPNNKRDVVIEIPKIDTLSYSYLTNRLVNDPLAVTSTEFYSFINRIKYLDILRNMKYYSYSISISEIAKCAKDAKVNFLPEEEELISQSSSVEDSDISKRSTEIRLKYQAAITNFFKKNGEIIEELNKSESFNWIYDTEDAFRAKGIELTADEQKFFQETKRLQSREQAVAMNKASQAFYIEKQKAIQDFIDKYAYLVRDEMELKRYSYYNDALKRLFKVEKGIASDIIYSQDLCRGIVEEATPMDTELLRRKLAWVSTPFIADYILTQNENTKAKLEANNQKTGYAVNIAPSVEADKLFDAMLAKFKGKVVFVDFWATWCGPCRSGIERIKPLKEEMAGKDIVFLYITGPSSPEGTWKNMIPDIKGEHYRVNADEWNTICGKFNISGIPHYALVDKNGVVAKNDGMPEHDLNAMKKMFEEFMAK